MHGIKFDGQIEIMPKTSASQDISDFGKCFNRLVSIPNQVNTYCKRTDSSPGNYSENNYPIPLNIMESDQDELCSRRARSVETEAEAELRVDIKHLPSAFNGYRESHQQNASNVALASWVNGYMPLLKWNSSLALIPLQHKENPLMSALREAEEDLLPIEGGYHLAGRDLSLFDEEGYTPLTRAAYFNQPDRVRQLIKFGADINSRDASGRTPLIAAVNQNCTEIAKILLDAGADKNKPCLYRCTPLLTASRLGRTECVRILIRAGANLNIKSSSDWSPLSSACKEGAYDIARLLIEAGADVNLRNNANWTPLLSVCRKGAYDIARLLVEAGANVDLLNDDAWSALMVVIDGCCGGSSGGGSGRGGGGGGGEGGEDFAKYLIKKGAIVAYRGRNPFFLATIRCSESVLRVLFDVHSESVIVFLAQRDNESFRLLDLIKENMGEDFLHFVGVDDFFSLKNMCRQFIQRHIENEMLEKLPLPNSLRRYCWRIPVLVRNKAEWEEINEDADSALEKWRTINEEPELEVEEWESINGEPESEVESGQKLQMSVSSVNIKKRGGITKLWKCLIPFYQGKNGCTKANSSEKTIKWNQRNPEAFALGAEWASGSPVGSDSYREEESDWEEEYS